MYSVNLLVYWKWYNFCSDVVWARFITPFVYLFTFMDIFAPIFIIILPSKTCNFLNFCSEIMISLEDMNVVGLKADNFNRWNKVYFRWTKLAHFHFITLFSFFLKRLWEKAVFPWCMVMFSEISTTLFNTHQSTQPTIKTTHCKYSNTAHRFRHPCS